MDLTFILDSSGSIQDQGTNFTSMLKVVKGIVSGLVVGPQDTHVAIVSYSNTVTNNAIQPYNVYSFFNHNL